jgi:hypothetical protein
LEQHGRASLTIIAFQLLLEPCERRRSTKPSLRLSRLSFSEKHGRFASP